MRRIGSNIRKQNQDAKSNRPTRNIIRYSDNDKPKNDYPKRIISPSRPSNCCTDDNRELVGSVREVDGFKFYPAVDSTSDAVKDYRRWKRYMTQ